MTNNSGYYGSWGAEATTASPYWQNIYNAKAEWAPCYYDATHILSSYAIYELPVGRGKAYGSNMNKVANAVVGGWTVSPILSLRKGFDDSLWQRRPVWNKFSQLASQLRLHCPSPGTRANLDARSQRHTMVYQQRQFQRSGSRHVWELPSPTRLVARSRVRRSRPKLAKELSTYGTVQASVP